MTNWSERMAERCANDGEFRLAARYWDGSLRVMFGRGSVELTLVQGVALDEGADQALGFVGVHGPREVWDKILAPLPPPMFNDIMPARAAGLVVHGDEETFWQYYPAVRRLVDMLREEVNRDDAI